MKNWANMTRDEQLRYEKNRLSKLYNVMDDNKKRLAEGLIDRAAFMRVHCYELEKDLNENGWTEKFSQGDQEPYDRARPQGQSYQTLNANYQKIIKQLDSMLPADAQPDAAKEMREFLSGDAK